MVYGVTNNGFVRKTNEQIIADLETDWKLKCGQDSDLSTDSPNSILVGLIGSMGDILWHTAEDTYNSLYRNLASGISLENAVNLVGIKPKLASATTVGVSFRGDNSTLIPALTQVKQATSELIFQTTSDNYITSDACNLVQIEITNVLNSTIYRVYVDSIAYDYTSDSSASADEIINGLKATIEGALIGLSVTNEGSGIMLIEAIDKNDIYDISPSINMTILKSQSLIEVTCLEVGHNEVAPETVTEISTAVSGLDSVINYYAGNTGRANETDQELRLRTQQTITVTGFNFADSIRARLLNLVDGVDYCRVYENDTLATDSNGIPAKSYEPVVEGGSNLAIANQLFLCKSSGVPSYGDISVEIKDSQNIPHLIKFSRPTNLYIWVRVTINSYNAEESFASNGDIAIKQSILDYCQTYFNIGDIIVTQKLYKPLFEVEGIGSATIEIASTPTDIASPTYSTANINLSIKQKPNFNLSRIEVIL